MGLSVRRAAPDEPDVAVLIARHEEHCGDKCPSNHVLSVDGLKVSEVTVFAAEDDSGVVGIGALKALPTASGELKSMHTSETARGRGVGSAILDALLREAKARGYSSVFLETGVDDTFHAARILYERRGFERVGPFGAYREDPASAFYRPELSGEAVR